MKQKLAFSKFKLYNHMINVLVSPPEPAVLASGVTLCCSLTWTFAYILVLCVAVLQRVFAWWPQTKSSLKQALDEQHKQEKSTWKAMFGSAFSAMFVTDQRGIILAVPIPTVAISGYQASELVGQPVRLILPDACVPQSRPALESTRVKVRIEQLALKGGFRVPVEIVITEAF
jgi:PAS domain S-box-containing protein